MARKTNGFFDQAEKLTTSGLARLSRTAGAAARLGFGSVLGKLRKGEEGWGDLNPSGEGGTPAT